MEVLAFSDAHIKPTGDVVVDDFEIPSTVDAVVVAGDVVHRTDPDSVAVGREFLAHLDAADPPVFCVPGNHDPLPVYDALLDDLDVSIVHETYATVEMGDESLSVVGWGLETTTFAPEIELNAFPALDPGAESPAERYAIDRASTTLETLAYERLVEGDAEDARKQARDVAEELGIARANRGAFVQQWRRLRETYRHLSALVDAPDTPTLVLTHVPPFNTPLDVHHSLGDRDRNLDGYHVGSLALTLALREHAPLAALSGHSHRERYATDPTHLLGLGYQGVVSVDLNLDTGAFGYRRFNG